MASAVNEVASLLGLPTANQAADDLKSPEQHQASMFAARQQLQAQQNGEQTTSPSFSRQASPGVKKVATIKPQFKTLSKKSTGFQTPFTKKEEDLKKMSPQKHPVNKNIEKLRSPSSPKFERRLPTVSSRYHSPSLKRQRGRNSQVDSESFHSDDEHKKLKSPTKKSPSPIQKPVVKQSPKMSPKPKMSPARPSPKLSPKLSPIRPGVSDNKDSLTTTPTKSSNCHSPQPSPSLFDEKETIPKEENLHEEEQVLEEQNSSEKENVIVENYAKKQKDSPTITKSRTTFSAQASPNLFNESDSEIDRVADKLEENVVELCSSQVVEFLENLPDKENVSEKDNVIEDVIKNQKENIISAKEDPTKEKDTDSDTQTAVVKGDQKKKGDQNNPDPITESSENSDVKPEDAKSNNVELDDEDFDSTPVKEEVFENAETLEIVDNVVEDKEKEEGQIIENDEDNEEDNQLKIEILENEQNEDVNDEFAEDKESEPGENKIIEPLLTPQESKLNVSIELSPPKKKSKKRKSQKITDNDEADRQKVNDFFHQKFGISFSPTSTPKGADRPKPLLKFSRKDGSDTERFNNNDYSPSGKFKSTFKALGSSPEKGGEGGKKADNAPAKDKVKSEKEEPALKKQPAKRKIERSPVSTTSETKKARSVVKKRGAAAVPVKRKLHTSSSSSHSSSESSDSDMCSAAAAAAASVGPVKKSTAARARPVPARPVPARATPQRKPPVKQQPANKVNNRKRKKVYSSSSSSTTTSDTEDEFSFSRNNATEPSNGIWVQCEKCDKWRYLRDMTDPTLLPSVWICSYNPDKKYNNCNAPEERWTDLENGYEFVYDAYSLGSLVWCKMQGYPWWPGMIDNDPFTKTFYYKHANSQLPDKYHVTFFGKQATRAWIGNKFIKVYNPDDKDDKYDQRKSSKGMREAVAMANQAFYLELNDRHKIYGFKELCKSEEYEEASSSSSKGKKKRIKTEKGIKISKKHSCKAKSQHSYLFEAALAKLSPNARNSHTFNTNKHVSYHLNKGTARGRGRPRKNSVDTATTTTATHKPKPATKKPNKRAKHDHKKHALLELEAELESRDSYIPAPSAPAPSATRHNNTTTRLNNLNVIENIEHEINQVLRDCSPSPTRL